MVIKETITLQTPPFFIMYTVHNLRAFKTHNPFAWTSYQHECSATTLPVSLYHDKLTLVHHRSLQLVWQSIHLEVTFSMAISVCQLLSGIDGFVHPPVDMVKSDCGDFCG